MFDLCESSSVPQGGWPSGRFAALNRMAYAVGFLMFIGLANASRGIAGGRTMDASRLARTLRAQSVALPSGSVIHGDLILNHPRTHQVIHQLRCEHCRFDGDIIGYPGARFAGALDLTRSLIRGKVRLSGVSFRGGVFALSTTFDGIVDIRRSTISRQAEFSEARFNSGMLASAAQFNGRTDFSLASFLELANFPHASFSGVANFTLATFAGDAFFSNGRVQAQCTRRRNKRHPKKWHLYCLPGSLFIRSTFEGSTDFDFFTFGGPAIFTGAQFKGHTDFSSAEFDDLTDFTRAQFAHGATFLAASFYAAQRSEPSDTFQGIESDGDLNFSYVTLDLPTDFEDSQISKTMSFSSAGGAVKDGVNFSQVTAGTLIMPVDFAVKAVDNDNRQTVLSMIESSAKERGDLGTANDAHYESLALRSKHYRLIRHALDFAFYRTVAGYLVRPLQPFKVLIVLVALMAFFRSIGSATRIKGTWHRQLRHVSRAWFTQLKRTLLLILPERLMAPSRRSEAAGAAGVRTITMSISRRSTSRAAKGWRAKSWACARWFGGPICRFVAWSEVLMYRALLACILIGLANANPTLREMLRAFH
jgi:uncharacterized protein YjbI with pentapeptide repeats